MKKKLFYYLGIGSAPVSNHEKIISALGEFIGIYRILYISTLFVGAEEMVCIVTSMGASTVLLFAVPYSCSGTALECNWRSFDI